VQNPGKRGSGQLDKKKGGILLFATQEKGEGEGETRKSRKLYPSQGEGRGGDGKKLFFDTIVRKAEGV